MPSRKRARQMNFRTGSINAAGQKNREGGTIIHKSVISNVFGTSATTSGDHIVFLINNYNTPTTPAASTTFGAIGLPSQKHPSGHVGLIADGYDAVEVLRRHYRLEGSWRGASRVGSVAVLAYKFSDSNTSATEPIFTAGAITNTVWLDMQQSPGWVWKKFGTIHNGGGRKTFAVMHVDIPNVRKLVRELSEPVDLLIIDPGNYVSVLTDSTAAPAVTAFLHIVMFILDKDGTPDALTLNDMNLEMRINDVSRVWKVIDSTDMIDEADGV